jgi:lipooligosaccharide transport system permease protein
MSSTSPTSSSPLVLRLFDYWAVLYRRTWRGSVISSFLTPLFYVVAMGVLLGGFVKSDPSRLDGASSYLAFVCPGLIASQTMTTVFGEVTWPVASAIKWNRTYLAMIATPLRVRDVVLGHLGFVLFRVGLVGTVFVLVLVPFGIFSTWWGVLGAIVLQPLIGLAFAGPVYAIAATSSSDAVFTLLFRVVMLPLFFFSGAFFPIGNLGSVLEFLARITPLWQGVDLTRMLAVGHVSTAPAVVHLVYLVVLALVGCVLAVKALERRLAS